MVATVIQTQRRPRSGSAAWQWVASFAAIVVTLIAAIIVMRRAITITKTTPVFDAPRAESAVKPGVDAVLKSGAITIETHFDALNLTLEAGEAPDERLPRGPWEGEFTVVFLPGTVRHARFGARLAGGSIIMMRDDEVILSDYSDDERIVLAPIPQAIGRAAQRLVFIFKTEGDRPVRLLAMWQPEDASEPQTLPVSYTSSP
jgi:hypothetical protein